MKRFHHVQLWRFCLATLKVATLLLATVLLFTPSPCQAREAVVRVDLTRGGAKINPYIYGQFIEHIGRCIHGGIWAEMLQDRKFLLAPGEKWQPTAPEDANFSVAHDSAGAYSGEHCLALWVRDRGGGARGIRQGHLGLIEGKEYVGYAVLCNVKESGPVTVRLSWGTEATDGQSVVLSDVGTSYKKHVFRFRAGATTEDASLSLSLTEPGYVWVGCLSLMPADNIGGMRADTLALIKKLNSPIYRWPGGNFVSGYDWKDGIGPRDRRPPRWERAWKDVEDNDFGIDEFMTFCRHVKTEPLIVVNTGLGSVKSAMEEIEYVNGPATSKWGARRAQNGHSAPYKVTWWGVGNEMFGDWQLGQIPVERYAMRHNKFARAMKAVDADIKLVGVGDAGDWNDVIIPRCAEEMDLLSGHFYKQRHYRIPFSQDDRRMYRAAFPEYTDRMVKGVQDLVKGLKAYQDGSQDAVDRLALSIDEWGIVREWKPKPDGPGIGIYEVYFPLGDAIACGRAVHEMIRSADIVQLAQWAQTVNVLGAIKTSRTHASLSPVGHMLALYRARLGGELLPVEVTDLALVDAVAAYDNESQSVSIAMINYSPTERASVKVDVRGATNLPAATGWRVHGPKLESINVPGQKETVVTTQLSDPLELERPVVLPAHSITVLQVPHTRK